MRQASGLRIERAAPHRQNGSALLTVLMTMVILQAVAWAFLYRADFEQRLSGGSARGLGALYLAEAGLEWTLDLIQQRRESDLALPHTEVLGQGTFTIETIHPEPDGLIAIIARGEAGGTHRRVKGLVRVGPEALTLGLLAREAISFDGQSRAYVIPTTVGESRRRHVGDLGVGRELRLESSQVALNVFNGTRLQLREGPISDTSLQRSRIGGASGGFASIALGEGGKVFSGVMHRYASLEELRRDFPALGIQSLMVRTIPRVSIPMEQYKTLAESNTTNAAINTAVAAWGLASELAAKAHSRYTAKEFQAILGYLSDEPEAVLRGPVFVDGNLYLLDRMRLAILDGALGVNGDISLMEGSRLEVRRSLGARVLPAMATWADGDIKIDRDAIVVADGLVLADGDILIEGGTLDVIGAVASRNFSTDRAMTVVRYDPAVLSTVGVAKSSAVAEIVSWQLIR